MFKNELKDSTANVEILNKLFNKKTFIQVEDYINQKLS